MNRRGFLKRVGVVVGVIAVPAIAAKKKMQNTDRSVVYGRAEHNYPKRFMMLSVGTGFPYGIPYYFGNWRKMGYVQVEVIKPIRRGQTIIWHPNGTISGGRKC